MPTIFAFAMFPRSKWLTSQANDKDGRRCRSICSRRKPRRVILQNRISVAFSLSGSTSSSSEG